MSILQLAGILAAVSVAGEGRAARAQGPDTSSSFAKQVWESPSPREKSIIDRMRVIVGDSQRTQLDRAVGNPSVFLFGRRGTSLGVLFDSLYAIRTARVQAISAGRVRKNEDVIFVAAVLLDSLMDPGATFEILRRPSKQPHDVVAFSARRLSLGVFGAAVRALRQERQEQGDEPSQLTTLVLRDSLAPTGWIENLDESARGRYSGSQFWPREHVEGVGYVPTMWIGLRRTRP